MSKRHLHDERVYRRSWDDDSPNNGTAASSSALNGTATEKTVGQVGSSVAEWCVRVSHLLPELFRWLT